MKKRAVPYDNSKRQQSTSDFTFSDLSYKSTWPVLFLAVFSSPQRCTHSIAEFAMGTSGVEISAPWGFKPLAYGLTVQC